MKMGPSFARTCLLALLVACTGIICQDKWSCKEAKLVEGVEGKILCLPNSDVANMRARWSRKMIPIEDGEQFRIERDGLVILKVDRTHAGEDYRVHWTDPDDGTETSKTAVVTVIVPPKFVNLATTVSSEIGDNVTLDLQVDSLPIAADCRWYDPFGKAVTDSDKVKANGCSIVVLDVQISDAGMFTCIAKSSFGVASTYVTLIVLGDTRQVTPPHPLMNIEKTSVTSTSLSISVLGPNQGPPVSSVHCIYSLLHPRKRPNEQNIIRPLGAGRNELTLHDLRPGFAYRVHCASVGMDGLRSQWSHNLDILLEPPVPSFWLEHLRKESLRLVWDLPTDLVLNDPNKIIEYQVSYKTMQQVRGQWRDDLFSCPVVVTLGSCGARMWDIFNPGKNFYSSKVRVRNQGGWSQWSPEIQAGGANFS